jgi:hypothetical protein
MVSDMANTTETTPCIYELEPIGVDGQLEAVAVRFFCSSTCRAMWTKQVSDVEGLDDSWIEGTVCDNCGKPLEIS